MILKIDSRSRSEVGRIAAVGFSAGSNSGVRTLLESELDRARLDFVAAVDGLDTRQAEDDQEHDQAAQDERSPRSPTPVAASWSSQIGKVEYARKQ